MQPFPIAELIGYRGSELVMFSAIVIAYGVVAQRTVSQMVSKGITDQVILMMRLLKESFAFACRLNFNRASSEGDVQRTRIQLLLGWLKSTMAQFLRQHGAPAWGQPIDTSPEFQNNVFKMSVLFLYKVIFRETRRVRTWLPRLRFP